MLRAVCGSVSKTLPVPAELPQGSTAPDQGYFSVGRRESIELLLERSVSRDSRQLRTLPTALPSFLTVVLCYYTNADFNTTTFPTPLFCCLCAVARSPTSVAPCSNTYAAFLQLSPCRTVGSAVLTDITTGAQVSGVDTAEIFFKEVRRLWRLLLPRLQSYGTTAEESIACLTTTCCTVWQPSYVTLIAAPHTRRDVPTLMCLMRSLLQIPDDVVTKLCDEGTVMMCAGGLMVEHALVQPYITKIDGSIDSVMGLSKALVDKLLEQIKQPS